MRRLAAVVFFLLAFAPPLAADDKTPSIDQMLNLSWPLSAHVSPDGKYVVYEVQRPNWDTDAFDVELWLAVPQTGRTFRLSGGHGSSRDPHWAPDGKRLAFVSDRGGRPQVYAIAPDGGEAWPVTAHDTGVLQFRWAPDGRRIAFTARDPYSPERIRRQQRYGSFEEFEGDAVMAHLWEAAVPDAAAAPPPAKRLTQGGELSVWSFDWAPDGRRIAFSAARSPAIRDFGDQDLYVLDTADGSVKKVVGTKGPDRNPVWSPDGKRIAYESANDRDDFFYRNAVLAVVPADGGEPRVLTADFDENPNLHGWGPDGLYFSALRHTSRRLYRLDPDGKAPPQPIGGPDAAPNHVVAAAYSFTADFKATAFVAAGPNEMPEAYLASVADFARRRLTALGDPLRDFRLARREVVRWKSADGTTVEGVLTKPADFEPGRTYPLLVVIHGGPVSADTPAVPRPFAYPLYQLAARGALVLQPNYRGSAGYGAKFRGLNVRNLGVGDAEDVLSGVDSLIEQGLVDRDRVGVMGWSQGGYITAFLSCSGDRFKAASVGAGISDWMTYYSGTDIPPFTRQYLGATPWDDPEVYRKTSPIAYLKSARTPTLIQHGDHDERVPIANGYELYRGLKDRGVPVKMYVYRGHDHAVYRPREQRALMEQNGEWFGQYLWGDKPAR